MAKREVVDILRKYIFILRSEGITIDKAYLYGSHLSNTATDESDIDVMIVTETEDDYLTGKIWNLTRKVNSKIEPYLQFHLGSLCHGKRNGAKSSFKILNE